MKRLVLIPLVSVAMVALAVLLLVGADEDDASGRQVATTQPTTAPEEPVALISPATLVATTVAPPTTLAPPEVAIVAVEPEQDEPAPVDQIEPAAVQRPTEAADRPAQMPPMSVAPPGFDLRRPGIGAGGLTLAVDAPDPDMLVAEGAIHLFSTNTSAANVPVWRTPDLKSWEFVGDALPSLPAWANPFGGTTWAPSVRRVGDRYVLYFSQLNINTGRFCVGVATSASATGPYAPTAGPLVCQTDLGGAIDPDLFVDDDGSLRLIYKTDGNCCGIVTRLWSQGLTADGLGLVGGPSELLAAGAPWEVGMIEGATMVKRGGRYHLLYSGNWWHTHQYAIGHAVCASAAGPCYRSETTPFMGNRTDGVGFGGPSFWVSPIGEVWVVYHGWYGAVGYDNGGVRAAFTHRVDFPDWSPPPPPTTTSTTTTSTTTTSTTTTSTTTTSTTTTSTTTTSPAATSTTTTTVAPGTTAGAGSADA